MSFDAIKENHSEILSTNELLDFSINDWINEFDFDEMEAYNHSFKEYVSNLSSDGVLGVHKRNLSSIRKNISLVCLRVIGKYYATTKSYLDFNVVAYKVGQKLSGKMVVRSNGTKERPHAGDKLMIGADVLAWFLNATGLGYLSHRTNAEKHKITEIILTDGLKDSLLTCYDIGQSMRALKPTHYVPFKHKHNEAGGYSTSRVTMTQSDKFRSIVRQSGGCLTSINWLQEVPYNVRKHLPSGIKEYRKNDRFWSKDLSGAIQFMDGEWSKFVSDLEEFSGDKPIYFPHNFDGRGRIYDRPNYIKIQGDSMQKALIEFHKKEALTLIGKRSLSISIASELYSDKISFEDALSWFDDNYEDIISGKYRGASPMGDVLVNDYLDYLDGKPVGTISHWDASNSALQMYTLLGGDKQGALACNLIGDELNDAYDMLKKSILERVSPVVETDRESFKFIFMLYLYGGGKNTLLNRVVDKGCTVGMTLLQMFEGISEDVLYSAIEEAMMDVAPEAVRLRNILFSFAEKGRNSYSYVMPDGFRVEWNHSKLIPVQSWYIDSDKTHSISIDTFVHEFDESDRSIAANIIHSVDSYLKRRVILRFAEAGLGILGIHDDFGVHPNNVDFLLSTYAQEAADILNGNLLFDILHQINPVLADKYLDSGALDKGLLSTSDVLDCKYPLR